MGCVGAGCGGGLHAGTRHASPGTGGRRTHHHSRSARPLRILSLSLGFLLPRQNRLHHIAGLGDVGKINLGTIVLLASCARRRRWPRTALKMTANLLSLMRFNGTRVSLALSQTHKFQSIENLLTLDFQLTRQIVNSNLTHPPLFVALPG
jgi:hypothetical protein